jgi:hypothetical protein
MDWLTEHFDVLLPVALVLLFLFQRFFVREEGEGGPLPSDSETEDEARRIQEEIRRKIIARQQGRTLEEEQPPAYEEPQVRPATFPRRQEQPPPFAGARPSPAPPPPRPQPVRQAEPVASGRDIQAELRIQRERLREAREAKEDALRRTASRGTPRTRRAVPVRSETGDLRGQLLADLATGDSMKKAFLLKEIVDRPVGLRDRPDVFSNWG